MHTHLYGSIYGRIQFRFSLFGMRDFFIYLFLCCTIVVVAAVVIPFVLGTFDIIQCRLFICAVCARTVHVYIAFDSIESFLRWWQAISYAFLYRSFLLKKRYEFKLMIVTRRSDFNPFNVQLILVCWFWLMLAVSDSHSLYFWSLPYGFGLICKHHQQQQQ